MPKKRATFFKFIIAAEVLLLIIVINAFRSVGTTEPAEEPQSVAQTEVSSEEDLPAVVFRTEAPELNVLGTISEDMGSRIDIGAAEDPYKPVAQSMSYLDGRIAVAFTDGPETQEEGVVKLFDEKGAPLDIQSTASLFHANSSCWTDDGTLIVARMDADTDIELDASSDKITELRTRYLPYIARAIAYDRDTKKYVLRTGPSIILFDGAIEEEAKTFGYKPRLHEKYSQDMCAGGGYFYSCHTIDKVGDNYIDIYSEEDGEYYGSYKVDYGELESADIINGELVILVHMVGEPTNYLQFTGIKDLPEAA